MEENWEDISQSSDILDQGEEQDCKPVIAAVSTYPTDGTDIDCERGASASEIFEEIPDILVDCDSITAEAGTSGSPTPSSSASSQNTGEVSPEAAAQPGRRVKHNEKSFTPNILECLLKQTVTGQQILERGIAGALSNASQRELVDIIAEYHCASDISTTEEVLREYADSITCLFKNELKVYKFSKNFPTTDYFIPQ